MQVRRERKVISVVFVDLVGFTARAEAMDPEDVDVELTRYHLQVRRELERHGGTVEKFIGDAVMAVFGAPVVHEDDAERAVRAAIAIREWASAESSVDVRVGVNSGEALVRLGARPDAGEGMAVGDVVNTAARLQAAAPVNGVLVGATTYRATRSVIAYEAIEPVVAKGKTEPVPCWLALQLHERTAGGRVGPRARFVGREEELSTLRSTVVRAGADRDTRLVTVCGPPGIGKSRLLHELMRIVHAEPDLLVWRQGRCLPYGEGVNFWALSELVKAEAGILANDPLDVVAEKLAKTVEARGGAAQDWMLARLRPLVGLADPDVPTGSREEQFAAWRQFIHGFAAAGPAVVVIEDLHWADDNLLDFVVELVDGGHGVPLTVLCTARPDLVERRPGWGSGSHALTLPLQPLPPAMTRELIDDVLAATPIDAEVEQAILDRADGNPLYAEEFARMVAESPQSTMRLPDTVQGIIAARLDRLDSEQKTLLQTAAVIGKVFWAGAVAELSGLPSASVERELEALAGRDFIRRERRSSLPGDAEYAFRHIVTREVAYTQLPRADRCLLHERVAEWIVGLGRREDYAEQIAHHYGAALDHVGAATDVATRLAGPARRALRDAGERAVALQSHASAADYFARALELTDGGDEQAELLASYAVARWAARAELVPEFGQAVDRLEECGRVESAARVATLVARAHATLGDYRAAAGWLDRAEAFAAQVPTTTARHVVALTRAGLAVMQSDQDAARAAIEPSVEELAASGRADMYARALDILGLCRAAAGDDTGIDVQRRAVDVARAGGATSELLGALNNLAVMLTHFGRLREAAGVLQERETAFATFGGPADQRLWLTATLSCSAYCAGDWDGAEAQTSRLLQDLPAGSTNLLELAVRPNRARMLLARDPGYDPRPELDRTLLIARAMPGQNRLASALADATMIFAAVGAHAEALALWPEALDRMSASTGTLGQSAAELAWAAVDLDRRDEAATAFRGRQPTAWDRAAQALLRLDFGAATEEFRSIGHLPYAALAGLRAGGEQASAARDFFATVGAARYLDAGRS